MPDCKSSQQFSNQGSYLRTRQPHQTRAWTGAFTAPSTVENQPSTTCAEFVPPPTFLRTSGRIIAIGDIHGDVQKAITSLKLGGVLVEDSCGRPVWCGGNTVVVQLGDVLDRGDSEIGAIILLRELDRQARLQGGAVYMLNGNHESLNVAGNFRYVTPGGFRESALVAGLRGEALESMEKRMRARLHLYSPGGRLACELAKNPTVLLVNDTVFAHGGVLPVHVKYGLERLNAEVAAWMRGAHMADGTKPRPPYLAMGGPDSVMWNRQFGHERFSNLHQKYQACGALDATLRLLGARQLIVGHTPQPNGANCECNGRVWRMDVGMSKGVLDAAPQVLEIEPEDASGKSIIRVLCPPTVPRALLPAPDLAQLRTHYPL
ncbi:g7478 [Coccomyxa elongata]